MMAPQEHFIDAFNFLYTHPRTRPVILSLVAGFVVKQMVCIWWQKWQHRNKVKLRRTKAELRKTAVENHANEAAAPSDLMKKPTDELLKSIKNGEYSVTEVLHTFQKQAMQLTKSINCVCEPVVEAEEQAKTLDLVSDKKSLLYGLPISVKENISITGYDTTAGMEVNIDKVATEDAVVIQVLKRHGAVPFVRTNIPQTMMSYACENPLYGETVNPLDLSRTPGGSSGGEAAIIGGGGSICGIGTDMGGSLRIPADFCGIYTIKPTSGRISTRGVYTVARGHLAIQGVVAPLSRDLDTLVLLMQALMSPEMLELDRSLPYLPFNSELFKEKGPLRIGFYTFDGTCQCQPPVVRAVMEAKKALESMGHEVVPFDFPKILGSGFQNGDFFIRIMTADRGENVIKLLANDEVAKPLVPFQLASKLPRWLLRGITFVATYKDKFSASILGGAMGFKSVGEYFTHVSSFLDWQEEFAQAWVTEGLDAVICPVFPSPAVTRDVVHRVTACGLYCQLYNSLNYPSGVLPVIEVSKEDLDRTFDAKIFTPNSLLEKILLESTKGSLGMSVGVQCVALPFKEEICLRVMKDIEAGLQQKE